MKREIYVSVVLTKDEHMRLMKHIGKYMMETGEYIKQGPMLRQLAFAALDNEQDNEPIEESQDNELHEQTPTIPEDKPDNPFKDLTF